MSGNGDVARARKTDYDVLVVGTGFGGLNALYTARAQGHRVLALEQGADVGGTWYWNRYPGARVDVESTEYSYAFEDALQQEWDWPLKYSEQPDVLRYLQWVSERLDLRKDIRFNARVRSAVFDPNDAVWTLRTEDGAVLCARYCIMAVGFLSAPYLPDIPGLQDFQGQLVHAAAWPQEGVDLADKRVGVVGTGSTGVQIVPVIAPETKHLTVFQRTPNWCIPIRNGPISEGYARWVKENYPEIRRREYESPGGTVLFGEKIVEPETRRAVDVSEEERQAGFERRWALGGFAIIGAWSDLRTNLDANNMLREFMINKIRSRVADPEIVEKLIPAHPVWSRRPPGETGYYEAFNRTNVTLVATLDDPIVGCGADGVTLASGIEHKLDVIIFATGFDAGTGAILGIDVSGLEGRSLADHWSAGVRTHLGMMTTGFPNLFFVDAAQAPGPFFSPPLLIDFQMRRILSIISEVTAAGKLTVEPTSEAEDAWIEHLDEVASRTLIHLGGGWWFGANIPGKERRAVAYAGGFPEYRKRVEAATEPGLPEYQLDTHLQELNRS